jgi:drug/metabolite transporter (DMT)-like permease
VPILLVVLFGLSIAGANASYYLSLARLPVAVAIVVQYTAPALVVLWAATVERRRPTPRVMVALVLAVGGVALLAELRRALSGRGALDPVGLLIAVSAAVAFATYMVTGERVGRELGSMHAVFRGFRVAAVFWAVFQIFRGRPATLLDASFVPGVLFLAVFTTIVPFSLFVWGMGRVQASRAGIVSTLEPVTAAVLAWFWLGERLAIVQVAGALMVVIGIGVVQSERPAAEITAPGTPP